MVDERTLREIYLTGFEIAVKEGGAKAIMTSYNEVNGIYANENQHLIKSALDSPNICRRQFSCQIRVL